MSLSSDMKTPVKRRQHSPEFKARVVQASYEPNTSVAGVAQRFGLNANLVHKWRRQKQGNSAVMSAQPAFIQLPGPGRSPGRKSESQLVRFEIPCASGTLTVDWPVDRIQDSVAWLKALLS